MLLTCHTYVFFCLQHCSSLRAHSRQCAQIGLLPCVSTPHTSQLIKCSVLIKFNYRRCVWIMCHIQLQSVCFIILIKQIHSSENELQLWFHLSCTVALIHFILQPVLSLWFFCPAARLSSTPRSERLKLNWDSYRLPFFHRVIPLTVCGPIPCERQMWSSFQTVPTRSLTPSVSKHVCLVSRCIAGVL